MVGNKNRPIYQYDLYSAMKSEYSQATTENRVIYDVKNKVNKSNLGAN